VAEETTTELVDEFAHGVARQSEALAKGEAVTGNGYAARYIAAFEKLRDRGDAGKDALSALLSDSRADVRVMAAAYLLRHCEARARAVLEAEAKGKGMIAFGAAQAIQRWEDGTWSLDPA
jgi:hypothetical protein